MMIIVVLSCYDCLFVSTDRSCCSYDSPLLIGRQNIFLWSSLSPCHRATIIAPNCFSMINATQCNSCNAWNSRNSANSFNFHFYWYHSVPPVALNCCTTILPSFIVIFYVCRHGYLITYVDLDRLYHHWTHKTARITCADLDPKATNEYLCQLRYPMLTWITYADVVHVFRHR